MHDSNTAGSDFGKKLPRRDVALLEDRRRLVDFPGGEHLGDDAGRPGRSPHHGRDPGLGVELVHQGKGIDDARRRTASTRMMVTSGAWPRSWGPRHTPSLRLAGQKPGAEPQPARAAAAKTFRASGLAISSRGLIFILPICRCSCENRPKSYKAPDHGGVTGIAQRFFETLANPAGKGLRQGGSPA